jgi:hypothetical protein
MAKCGMAKCGLAKCGLVDVGWQMWAGKCGLADGWLAKDVLPKVVLEQTEQSVLNKIACQFIV